MVGILVSFWEGLFSGSMLVSGRVTSYNYMSRCTVLHRSLILLQPEFLMKCVSRVWFCNQFPFCMGRSRYMAAFLFPKFEPEPHIYTYIPPPPKNNPKTHKRSGITIFWGDLSFYHLCPDDGLTNYLTPDLV